MQWFCSLIVKGKLASEYNSLVVYSETVKEHFVIFKWWFSSTARKLELIQIRTQDTLNYMLLVTVSMLLDTMNLERKSGWNRCQ